MENDLSRTPIEINIKSDIENQLDQPDAVPDEEGSEDETSQITVSSVSVLNKKVNIENLQNENELLKKELNGFNNTFFEEIENLKTENIKLRKINNIENNNFNTNIIPSRIFSQTEFKTLQKDFQENSNNDQISYKDLIALIEKKIDYQDYHSEFVEQYLNNLNNDTYTFVDYYSIINHLRNLFEIKSKKAIELTNEHYDKTYQLKKLYDELDKDKQQIIINKQREIIKREQQLIENRQNYENRIQLYGKDTYGITWKSCFCNILKCFYNDHIIKEFDKIYEIIKELPSLNNYEKNLILIRFQTISTYCLKHYNTISRWYNSTQLFIIACSIINPALLSINSNKDNIHYYTIFWSVWVSQLLVSLTTSYISFFKWDKKYFLFNGYKTKINQEIWLFIELSGNHYKSENVHDNNHSKHLNKFLNRLENLYKKLKLSEFEIETTNNDEENAKENTNKQMIEDILQSNRQAVANEKKKNNLYGIGNKQDDISDVEP